jgi:hypothetical protein
MLLDAGIPWWAFLMMPFMMLGMGLMMWFMMRMMMGMDHGSHGTAHPSSEQGTRAGESEVDALRRQVSDLQERLAAMEAGSEAAAPRSEERAEP